MIETLLILGKLIASSALLLCFYWMVLRSRASYRLARLYLLLIPFACLAMSGLTFKVYSPTMEVIKDVAPATSVVIDQPAITSNPTTNFESAHRPSFIPSEEMVGNGITLDSEDYSHILILLCGIVSTILIIIAAYHFVSLYIASKRLASQTTPEGYSLVRSSKVQAPCSFAKTIFMPTSISGSEEELILRHEKAHIYHGHFVDVWIIELMTRLLWFNPILWLTRKELRNIHEFEADHEVLTSGADVSVYQTLLLAQVMDNGSTYANGFNHSFIRRRFIEMKHSTAGTLSRLAKIGMGVWMVLLFCGFTFTEDDGKNVYKAQLIYEPQTFTIEGVVDEAIADSCYNIYLSDEFLEIDGNKPIATVPVVNKRFSYSVTLDRVKAGRVRCIFPGGELCSAWIDIFFVPGETVKLTVHNGYYDLQPKNVYNYDKKISRGVNALRASTNWQTPHLPKLSGKKWENVEGESSLYPLLNAKEVIFGKDETYLRLYTDVVGYGSTLSIGKGAYLLDDKGNKYAIKRMLNDNLGELTTLANCVFGGYYAFEPVPDDVKELTFIEPDREAINESGETIKQVIAHIKPVDKAKKEKSNFQVDVTVSQGINDSGYLVYLYDQPHVPGYGRTVADIPTKDRHCTFSTYISEPCMGQFTATFPDGSICTHSMRFPFVPGEHAELKVMNGSFYLTGSKFYKEWGNADELVENARKYRKPEETKALLVDYLKKHANEEGCVVYYMLEDVLPYKTIKRIVPFEMLTGRFLNMLEWWYDIDETEEE